MVTVTISRDDFVRLLNATLRGWQDQVSEYSNCQIVDTKWINGLANPIGLNVVVDEWGYPRWEGES